MREELLADVVVSRESNGGCDWLMLKREEEMIQKQQRKVIRICEKIVKAERKN